MNLRHSILRPTYLGLSAARSVALCHQKWFFISMKILTGGDVNTKKRMPDVNNQVVYELEPGVYNLETFESYTFKYLKVIVLKGKCPASGYLFARVCLSGKPESLILLQQQQTERNL